MSLIEIILKLMVESNFDACYLIIIFEALVQISQRGSQIFGVALGKKCLQHHGPQRIHVYLH